MPAFTNSEALSMLSHGGSGFRSAFTVTAPTAANGVGWHTKYHFDAANNLVDREYHTLVIPAGDTSIPFQLPETTNAVQITVSGVADGGGDLSYAVKSIEDMSNGFRRLVLLPVFVSPISFGTITIPNLTANTESNAIPLTATGADNIEFSFVDIDNATARIDGSNLYINAISSGSITIRAEVMQYRKDQVFTFQVS